MTATALSSAERRRPWILLSPALITLFVLMIMPIAIMTVFSFYEFVTGGVEREVFTTANWREFFTDSFYHMFLWKTVRVAAITAILCAVLGYPPAYFIAMSTYKHKWLLLLLRTFGHSATTAKSAKQQQQPLLHSLSCLPRLAFSS